MRRLLLACLGLALASLACEGTSRDDHASVDARNRCDRLLAAGQRLLGVTSSIAADPGIDAAAVVCLGPAVAALSEVGELGAACVEASASLVSAAAG